MSGSIPNPKVVFISRRPCEFVSIERVFDRIAKALGKIGLKTRTQTLPYGSGIAGIILNLLFFRPEPADVYHITGHVHFIALCLPRERTVMTVHDVRFLQIGKGLRGWAIRKLFLELPLKRVSKVTVISEATRAALVAETGMDEADITVIDNPIGEEFTPTETHLEDLRTRVLHVGTMENKNLPRLVEALTNSTISLHVVGRLSKSQKRLLDESGIDYKNDECLDSDGMLEAYRQASVLAFCSTEEGFGLPIIEANAVGLPVVTSDRSPMRDVAGDAALLIDPDDPTAIRAAIEMVLAVEGLRDSLRSKGFENAKRFAPETVARRYLNVYLDLESSGVDDGKD